MRRLFFELKELMFPRRCMLCRTFLGKEETDLCRNCFTQAPFYPFGAGNLEGTRKNNLHFLDSFTAVWYYDGDVRRSILRYKFYKGTYLAPKFGRMLAMAISQRGPEKFDILTWVPVSRLRRLRRGYDQCALLSKYVGRELGVAARPMLRKKRHTPPQTAQPSAEMRRANILGAYEMLRRTDVRGKSVLLLDDVFTTGATMNECARILLMAGAKEVHGAAIAASRNHK